MSTPSSRFQLQHEAIREEFGRQAESWGRDEIDPDLLWAVDRLALAPGLAVLDVAAGTGLLARAIAPRVASVVAVDLTPEMLDNGRRSAERDGIRNLRFEAGAAEELPYPSSSFDAVVTRFSFHHFQDPKAVMGEMVQVCRAGGTVGVIDIVAPEEKDLADLYNRLERLRDPTHTRALPPGELRHIVEDAGIRITGDHRRDVGNDLLDWLDRTRTSGAAREEILERLESELSGGPPTGMRPFASGGRQGFTHDWQVVTGVKV